MEVKWDSHAPLDPLSGTLVRLLGFDLLSIQQHPHLPGTFMRKRRPVRKVEIVGVIVSVDRRESYLHFKCSYAVYKIICIGRDIAVDDGTGCIPCILWTNHFTSAYFSHLKEAERQVQAGIAEAQVNQVKLGRVLRVQGRISFFRNQLQITVFSLVKEEDPNAEVLQWMQCMQLALRCYDLPFSPTVQGQQHPHASH